MLPPKWQVFIISLVYLEGSIPYNCNQLLCLFHFLSIFFHIITSLRESFHKYFDRNRWTSSSVAIQDSSYNSSDIFASWIYKLPFVILYSLSRAPPFLLLYDNWKLNPSFESRSIWRFSFVNLIIYVTNFVPFTITTSR